MAHVLSKQYVRWVLCITIVWMSMPVSAATSFSPHATYQVCFTPHGQCTQEIVELIGRARHTVLLQAYSFTSAPIAKALVMAKRRGVNVKVILDKSQIRHNKYSSARFLMHYHIPIWIDYHPNIAHNKIIIVDGSTVETGSFNYTKNAQYHNAENVLIIKDQALAKRYTVDWYQRQRVSATPTAYLRYVALRHLHRRRYVKPRHRHHRKHSSTL